MNETTSGEVILCQQQIADLFQTTKQNVSVYAHNIFEVGEKVLYAARADEARPTMSLTSFAGARPCKSDISFAMEAPNLKRTGNVSHKQAASYAVSLYAKYRAQFKIEGKL